MSPRPGDEPSLPDDGTAVEGPAPEGPAPGEAAATVACPACGEPVPPEARFCEACGADLPGVDGPGVDGQGANGPGAGSPGDVPALGLPGAPGPLASPASVVENPAPCRECGGTVDADGYCTTCGAKAPPARDHVVERPRPWVAGVSDRGRRHHRNEDALAVAADPVPGSRAVLVVCDGVSSAPDSDVASLAAARAAVAVLLGSRAQGMGTPSARVAVTTALLSAAADAAAAAVRCATSPDRAGSPPSCTLVGAVVERDLVVAGVVGDSRAYWVPDVGEPVQLTVDDSWAAMQIAMGVSREAAESGPQAHAITRWLGVDSPDHTPRVTSLAVGSAGWVVACSDGLWNYASAPDALAVVVRQAAAAAGGDPFGTASALVDWANEQGGHDNITVALARLAGPGRSPAIGTVAGEDDQDPPSERTRNTGGPR